MGESTTIAGDAPVAFDPDPHPGPVDARRADVVQRLLDRGVSPVTLSVLLPEFADTIASLSAGR